MPIHPAAEGAVVAVMTALPTLMTHSQSKPGSVLPILGIGRVLGAAVGWLTSRFAA